VQKIANFGAKYKFYLKYDRLDKEEKRKHRLEDLEYVNDTFPLSEDEAFSGYKFGFWRKFENNNKRYLLFYKTPLYLDGDLFWRVMNGLSPHPQKTQTNDIKPKTIYDLYK
jgi:hypothetical protein